MTPRQLARRFGIESAVDFRAGPGGLTEAVLTAPGGSATVALHGAHVTGFVPAGAQPVLWMSRKSWFQPGKPIRGGIPVCFPWFSGSGPKRDSPYHGFARLMEWQVETTGTRPDGRTFLAMRLRADQRTRAYWPSDFELQYVVTVGRELELTLRTHNPGPGPFTITHALHSYFAVGDVRQVRIHGLAGTEYIDTVGPPERKRQGPDPIRFEGETDRTYLNTTATCILEDPVLARRITVAKSGSASTVVWNPWSDKAARMEDYADDEWPGMVCIETANVDENAVTLAPDGEHTLTARIRVET